jgi:hypothetical protein
MSRVSQDELSRDAAETARLVRLTLAGDSTAFERIILRYEAMSSGRTNHWPIREQMNAGKSDAQIAAFLTNR